jgi:prepilin-type N-terminal cleavage/methylation domain-containing protein
LLIVPEGLPTAFGEVRVSAMHHSHDSRSGTSLIELLVVLAIMGLMLSMLLPALNSAREAANETVCKNNLHQLSLALHNFRHTYRRLPAPNLWTVELLPFLEEQALADALWGSDPTAVPEAKLLPPIYSCTAQPQVDSTIAGTPIGHYMLVTNAPPERRGKNDFGGKITDRPADLSDGALPPWYVGPEIHPLEFSRLVKQELGPHRGGVFFPE